MTKKKTLAKTEDISKIFNIPTGTLSAWRTKGLGPKFYKIGRSVVYRLDEVQSYFESNDHRRIHGKTRGVVAYRQAELPLGAKSGANASPLDPESIDQVLDQVEAKTLDGKTETFQTLPLDRPVEDRHGRPAAPEMNFSEMMRVQIQATRLAAEMIKFSEAGKAFVAQTLAALETLGAWAAQIERKVN